MTCKNCGSKNNSDSTYCSNCGNLVDEALYTRKKKELAKTLIFLITTLAILFIVIFRIQADFDSFIAYELPLNLTTEQARERLIGGWSSNNDTNLLQEVQFEENNFRLTYTHGDREMAGTYTVNDANTLTLKVLLLNGQNLGGPMDIQYKFNFQGDDTLIIVFNGISNTFVKK